jgi:coatomer subunit beta
MLIMTSTILTGQSKFVTAQIDEDSHERIMNCIETLSSLTIKPKPDNENGSSKAEQKKEAEAVREIFLEDGRRAFGRMLSAMEKRAVEEKRGGVDGVVGGGGEKKRGVQVDDLLTFRLFSKRGGEEDGIDVSWLAFFFFLVLVFGLWDFGSFALLVPSFFLCCVRADDGFLFD